MMTRKFLTSFALVAEPSMIRWITSIRFVTIVNSQTHSMKTIGNYEISNFHQIGTPVDRGNLKPLIYSGDIYDPVTKAETIINWDEDGKCSNWKRSDCFIN